MRVFQGIAVKFLAVFTVAFIVPAGVAILVQIDSNVATEREHLAVRIGTRAARVAAALDRHGGAHDPRLARDLLAPLSMDPDVVCTQLLPAGPGGSGAGSPGSCAARTRSPEQLRFPVGEGRATLLVAFGDAAIISQARSRRDLLLGLLLAGLLTAIAAALFGFRLTIGGRLGRLNGAIQQIVSGGERCPVPAMGNDELGRVAGAFNRLIASEEARESELRRTEAALRRSNDKLAELTTTSEQRFRDFVAFASDWYWEMDDELRFSYFSDRFTEVTGVPKDALLGKTRLESGIPNVDADSWREHLACLEEHRPFRDFEHPRTQSNGDTVWLSISGTPVLDESGVFKGYRGTGTDVTARVLAETLQQEKKVSEQIARTKDEFLANMSHEIRTPINGVLGMAELLHKTELDATQQRFASTILRSGQALLRVINDILDFSKLEAGKMNLQSAPFCLRELVEDVGELFAESAHSRGLELLMFVPVGIPTALWGDGGRLRQVLTNLVGNAIKFTERGEVMVNVGLSGEEGDECELRFEVRDTGIGVDATQQAHIFESFAQADGSTAREFGGTGLGLSISSQLCRLMGGDIGISSVPGAGSTFWFTVRIQKSVVQTDAVAHGAGSLEGVRVLVVDNHPINREILESQLSGWGIQCACAPGGAEALQMLGEAADGGMPYEVAILDMHMPGMDGAQLAARISEDPRFSGLRSVMLSSVGESLDRDRLQRAGILAHLLKPVRQAELHRCIDAVLNGVVPGESRPTPAPQADEGAPGLGSRVLLVEDNRVNQEVATAWLERAGATVTLAEHGQEAVDIFCEHRFDLVIMDCQMPGMNGFDATRTLREIESDTGAPRVPVVALTANALNGDRERCLAAGMDDYLSKPFTELQIMSILRTWLTSNAVAGDEAPGQGEPARDMTEIIDSTMLDNYRMPGAPVDLLGRVVGAYLSQSAGQMAQLRAAFASGDAAGVSAVAHTLKSSSAQLGATGFAEHLQTMEHAAQAGELEGMDGILAAVEAGYPEVCAELSAATRRDAA